MPLHDGGAAFASILVAGALDGLALPKRVVEPVGASPSSAKALGRPSRRVRPNG